MHTGTVIAVYREYTIAAGVVISTAAIDTGDATATAATTFIHGEMAGCESSGMVKVFHTHTSPDIVDIQC